MASRTDVVPIGTQIPIALETPIDTARPGLVRAIASRDTVGFDGRRVLIPRGSRFVGEYQSEVRSGQNRVFVTWTRVIRPDGVTIRLASPAADTLGGSGVPGRVNTFFLQKFAGAVLQSALSVGVNLASRPRAGSVIVGVPTAPVTTIGQGLVGSDYAPKITVKQGAALSVFVARDLDFSGLAAGKAAH
ncbi:TrbI/VirB10 family protein [Sphingomonas sp. 3-13AW]|uniref:TrbI/VirB10 family protein n=1 Tax=Sphingomonas sp. 3-13AW TaxID=3050450 RepID=UPI003BB5E02A